MIQNLVRYLRKESTVAEKLLWKSLRNSLLGFKFRRQYPIRFLYQNEWHVFVADFYCHAHRLVIELDGGHHQEKQRAHYDMFRAELIKILGRKVVRFENHDVLSNIDHVISKIMEQLNIK